MLIGQKPRHLQPSAGDCDPLSLNSRLFSVTFVVIEFCSSKVWLN